MELSRELSELLRCPVCYKKLNRASEKELVCVNNSCGKRFPIADGVPVLFREATSLFHADTTVCGAMGNGRRSFPKRIALFLDRILPTLTHNRKAARNFRKLKELLLGRAAFAQVLVVGCGQREGAGLWEILSSPSISCLQTDVVWGESVSVVCDCHSLPFADGSFDAVVAQAVLEHVVDPACCVQELLRVLKEGGYLYGELPFMQQVHLDRYDFTRYSRQGMRLLFRRFEELDCSMLLGPATALGWSVQYFFLSFTGHPAMRNCIRALTRMLFFWLKYFDFFLEKSSTGNEAASGFYFLGRKNKQLQDWEDLVLIRQAIFRN